MKVQETNFMAKYQKLITKNFEQNKESLIDYLVTEYENDQGIETMFIHSHKERKDSLQALAEWAALQAYVENHGLLEPILLYHASKHKLDKR